MELVQLSFTSVLQDILGGLFDSVLAPVLRDVFNILVNILGTMIHEIFSSLLLKLWIVFLKIIGFLESIFNLFSGISNVKVKDVSESISLLEYFFTLSEIQQAFHIVTLIAVVIAFLTTLFSLLKSLADTAVDNRYPISNVLKQAFQAAISFLVVPLACLFFLQMSTKLVMVVNTEFANQTGSATISDSIFITVASPEAKSDAIRTKYASNQKYQNADEVKEDFDYENFDYVMAYTSSILTALIMLGSILQFIQRIFMILLLYLSAPFFVAMIPLDGGAKFKEWKNMFAAHMLSAFGPILVMKIYLIFVPIIGGADISFNASATVTACIKLLFMVGGAFAVYKSRFLVISVINPWAVSSMQESGFMGAMLGASMAGSASKLAGAMAGKAASSMSSQSGGKNKAYSTESARHASQSSQGSSGSSGGGSSGSGGSQAYTGK